MPGAGATVVVEVSAGAVPGAGFAGAAPLMVGGPTAGAPDARAATPSATVGT